MNAAPTVESSISIGSSVRIAIWFGPPNVRAPFSVILRSGLTSPYSGRGASSISSSTLPATHSTSRSSSCGGWPPISCPRWPSWNAMASVSRTTPEPVVNVVSTTSVPRRSARSLVNAPVGRIDQWPAAGSRMRANTASLS